MWKYKNCDGEEIEQLKDIHERKLFEKNVSRKEKLAEKENHDVVLTFYELEVALLLPKGNLWRFYCKSKMNLFICIYNPQSKTCECYVMDKSHGQSGANELDWRLITRYIL